MDAPCSKCGSPEVVADVPVVTSKGSPVSALNYSHRFLARVCGACGSAELYVEDPKRLVADARRAGTRP